MEDDLTEQDRKEWQEWSRQQYQDRKMEEYKDIIIKLLKYGFEDVYYWGHLSEVEQAIFENEDNWEEFISWLHNDAT